MNYMKTRSERILSAALLGWLALCWAVLIPATGRCYTEVYLSSWELGLLGKESKVQTFRSFPADSPMEAAWSTGTNGGNSFGWMQAESRIFGRAEVGKLRLYAYELALAQANFAFGVPSQAGGMSRTTWTDNFTVNSGSAPVGTLATMTVNLRIGGDLMVGGRYYGENSYYRIFVRVYDSYGADTRFAGGMMYQNPVSGITEVLPMDGVMIAPGVWPVSFQVHLGRTTYITAWVEVNAVAKTEAWSPTDGLMYGEARSNFGDGSNHFGLVWEGVTDVRLTNGSPVTNFVSKSESGFDYVVGAIADPPVITRIQALNSGLALEWTDLGARSYTIETAESVVGGAWAPVAGVAWPIHVNTVVLPTPARSPAFFRVKVQ